MRRFLSTSAIESIASLGSTSVKLQVDAGAQRCICPIREDDPLPPQDGMPTQPTNAFETLYRKQAPRLLRFFAKRAERDEAGDLVQEAFVRFAHADERRTEPLRQPEAYLSQVATNLLRNRARAAFLQTTTSTTTLDELVDPLDLSAALEARDLLNRIQSVMMRLSPKTREIFLAHRVDGATYAQIAESTQLSVKTVEWHMTKAIRHLHHALGTFR